MNEHPQPDWLDAILKEPRPELPGGNFVAQVLAALPTDPARTRLRNRIVGLATFLAAVIALWLWPSDAGISLPARDWLSLQTWTSFSFSWQTLAWVGLMIWLSIQLVGAEE